MTKEGNFAENPPVATTRIRYMGNKHLLAPDVARVVASERDGSPLIDLFAGMCSIAAAVAPSKRPVWSNDVQEYAALVARCQLASQSTPVRSPQLAGVLTSDFVANVCELRARFEKALHDEKKVLEADDPAAFRAIIDDWVHIGNDPALAEEAKELAATSKSFPFRLCSITFAHGYFGLRQAIEIDSIRYAIAQAEGSNALNADQARWALVALLQAASICAATPGHFAQYLRPHDDTSARRIRRQRLRNLWRLFLDTADSQNPFGSRSWRAENEVHCADALSLWPELDKYGLDHAIVYADPPYGKDQYSRYYHVLETLVRYDYPTSSGAGRYRPDRFTTPFSLKTKVLQAFRSLFAEISTRGWTLVLSYPSSGLLHAAHSQPLDELLSEYFSGVERAIATPTLHSTLGARHGVAKTSAAEIVWLAS
jgi:adenine-specific DNA-methyltransferase